MSKTKTRKDLADSGVAKQAGLSLLGAATSAGSRNKSLPKGLRRTLGDLRSVIADAEKQAKKESRKRKARKARKRMKAQLQTTAKAQSKTAAKKTAKVSAKAGGKVAKVSAKGTAKVGKRGAKTAVPIVAAKSGKKAVSVAGSRRQRRKARRRSKKG